MKSNKQMAALLKTLIPEIEAPESLIKRQHTKNKREKGIE